MRTRERRFCGSTLQQRTQPLPVLRRLASRVARMKPPSVDADLDGVLSFVRIAAPACLPPSHSAFVPAALRALRSLRSLRPSAPPPVPRRSAHRVDAVRMARMPLPGASSTLFVPLCYVGALVARRAQAALMQTAKRAKGTIDTNVKNGEGRVTRPWVTAVCATPDGIREKTKNPISTGQMWQSGSVLEEAPYREERKRRRKEEEREKEKEREKRKAK